MPTTADAMARFIYRLARLREDRAANPLDLATRALGSGAVQRAPHLDVPGLIAPIGRGWRIFLRPNLTRRRLAHVVGHELGHWICQREGVEDTEELCDAIGAAIVAPRPAFLASLHRCGPRLRELAWKYETTQSLVALRYAETTGAPLALVTPDGVRVRGAGYDWPPENELRALARSGGGEGLRAVRLRDDPRRVALTPCEALRVA